MAQTYAAGFCYDNLETIQDLDRYKKVVEICMQRLEESQLTRNELKNTYHQLENAFAKSANFELAKEYHLNILEIAKEERDKKSEGYAHENLGFAYQSVREFDKSKEQYKVALKMNKISRDNQVEQRINKNLGKLHQKLREYDAAVKCYEKVLILVKNTQDQQCEREIYEALGEIYQHQDNHEKAIEFHKKNRKLLQTLKRSSNADFINVGLKKVTNNLAKCHEKAQEYSMSLEYSKSYLKLMNDSSPSSFELAQAKTNVGRLYWAIGQYEKARYLYEQVTHAEEDSDDVSELVNKALESLGDLNVLMHDYDKAFKLYADALSHASKYGMKEREIEAYCKQGIVYQLKGSYQPALSKFEKALNIAQDLSNQEYKDMINEHLGNLYLLLGNQENATQHYMKVMENDTNNYNDNVNVEYHQRQLAKAKSKHDKNAEVSSSYFLGIANHLLGNHKEALECYQTAEKNVEFIHDTQISLYLKLATVCASLDDLSSDVVEYYTLYLKKSGHEGRDEDKRKAFESLGDAYCNLGKHSDAINAYQKALNIAKDGDVHWKLANLHQSLSEHDKAIEHFQNILESAKTDLRKREVYDALGSSFTSLEKYQEALALVTKSLKISRSMEDHQYECSSSEKLGEIYCKMKIYEQALECYKNVLRILEQCPQSNKEQTGRASSVIAYIYRQRREFDKSKEWYERAKNIAHETGDAQHEVKLTRGVGFTCRLNKEFTEAKEYYKDARTIAIKIKDKVSSLKSYGDIGKCYVGLEKYKNANTYFTNQLSKARRLTNIAIEGDALVSLANLCLLQGQNEQAIKHLEAFDKLDLKDNEILRKAKTHLCEAYRKVSQSYRPDNNLLKKKCVQQGFESWEQSFQEDFRCQTSYENNLRYSQELTPTYIQVDDPKSALSACQNGRERQLTDELIKRYNYQPNNAVNLLDVVKDGHFGAVVYSLDEHDGMRIWSLRCGDQEPSLYSLPNEQELTTCKKIVDSFYKELKPDEQSAASEDRYLQSFQQQHTVRGLQDEQTTSVQTSNQCSSIDGYNGTSMKQLFEKLIAPVKDKLTDIKEIVIDADGPLHKVPFAALQDPSGQFLSETKRIRIAPSLLTLKILMECSPEYHSKTGALVIGGPEIGRAMMNEKIKDFDPLPYAVKEGKKVATILETKALVRKRASKRRIKDMIKNNQPAIIHIAAHGGNGKIALAPSSRPQETIPNEIDYVLTMDDVKTIGVKAELVVLSCCYSGRGDITEAGDVMSMCRAFISAGARAVIASLWGIDDEKTLKFMKRFYKTLKKGESVGVSLHEAMKYLKRRRGISHPKHWAPFVHVGDDVTVFPNRQSHRRGKLRNKDGKFS